MECSNPQCPLLEAEKPAPSELPAAPVRRAIEAPKPAQPTTPTGIAPLMGVGLATTVAMPPRPVHSPCPSTGRVEALTPLAPSLAPGDVKVVAPALSEHKQSPPPRVASYFKGVRRGREEAQRRLPVRVNSGICARSNIAGSYEEGMFHRLLSGLHAMDAGIEPLPTRRVGAAKQLYDQKFKSVPQPRLDRVIIHQDGAAKLFVPPEWADAKQLATTVAGFRFYTDSAAHHIDRFMDDGPNGLGLPDFTVPDFSDRATAPATPAQRETKDGAADEFTQQASRAAATVAAFTEGTRAGRQHSEEVPMSTATAVPAVEVFRPGVGIVPLETTSFPVPSQDVPAVTPVAPVPPAPISVVQLHHSPMAGWKPLTDEEKRELGDDDGDDYALPSTASLVSPAQMGEGSTDDEDDLYDSTGDAWRRK